jgi:cyclic nucleotide-binding protein
VKLLLKGQRVRITGAWKAGDVGVTTDLDEVKRDEARATWAEMSELFRHAVAPSRAELCRGPDVERWGTSLRGSDVKNAKPHFDAIAFLATVDGGKTVLKYRRHQKIFRQGDPADAVFYVQSGQVKVCVISELGKEAVVALHGEGEFFGEGCLSGQPLRLARSRQ